MVNDELEGMWKDAVVGYVKVLSTHTHRRTKEKEER